MAMKVLKLLSMGLLLSMSMTNGLPPPPTCKGGSFIPICGSACPINCCTVDHPPESCFLVCVQRCQCPAGEVEVYDNNGAIKNCVKPRKCPRCPVTKPMRCDLTDDNVAPNGEYTVSVTKSSDPAKNAVFELGAIKIGNNGKYTITKGEDFHVLNVGFIARNAKKVILKGFNAGGNQVFKITLKTNADSNPNGGGISPGGHCTWVEKNVRTLELKLISADSGDITFGSLIVNACCPRDT